MEIQEHEQNGSGQFASLYPKIPSNRLPQNNTSVSVVGFITNLDELNRRLTLQVDPTNKQTVDVIIAPGAAEPAEFRHLKYIEVRGFSISSGEVEMKEYTDFKPNFDLKTYNEVIKLTTDGQFRSMFSGSY